MSRQRQDRKAAPQSPGTGRPVSRGDAAPSSSSMSSARGSGSAILETSLTQEPITAVGPGVSCVAKPYRSPLAVLYESPTFLVEWDNDLPYHLAQHLVRLRRYRGLSQRELAQRAGTSQPKIARIEGGEENVTLRTVQKMAKALLGRLTLALQPAEMQTPSLPYWWEYSHRDVVWSGKPLTYRGMCTVNSKDSGTVALAAWESGALTNFVVNTVSAVNTVADVDTNVIDIQAFSEEDVRAIEEAE
jgi:DNA-binding XRE family transcriptional regulator